MVPQKMNVGGWGYHGYDSSVWNSLKVRKAQVTDVHQSISNQPNVCPLISHVQSLFCDGTQNVKSFICGSFWLLPPNWLHFQHVSRAVTVLMFSLRTHLIQRNQELGLRPQLRLPGVFNQKATTSRNSIATSSPPRFCWNLMRRVSMDFRL